MKATLHAFCRDESGLTMVEYAFGGALIITVCAGAIASVGGKVAALLEMLSSGW